MSLILDALSRSRSDASSVPGVDTYHSLEDLTPAWRRYLPWLALVVAVLLILVLLLDRAGLLPGGGEGGASASKTAAPVAGTRGAPAANPKRAPAAHPGKAPAAHPAKAPAARTMTAAAEKEPAAPAATRQDVSVGASTATPPPRQVSAPTPAPVAVKSAEEVAAEAAVADLYRERNRVREEQPQAQQEPTAVAREDEQPIDLEQMLKQARAETQSGEFVDHPASFIGSLSQQTRNPIPTILYQRHDYSGEAARASVVMNGKTLRVGGSPAAGVKLDEILPNSAVLSYRGTQFRLRALNSWVNL